jgi:hypothetical protein
MPERLRLRRFHRGEKILLQAKLHYRKLPACAVLAENPIRLKLSSQRQAIARDDSFWQVA